MSATGGGNTINFSYNEDGSRASKTVNGTRHNYTWDGKTLVRDYYGNTILDFSYDANGQPYAMYYNSTPYFYILNLQGDVIRMVDGVGNIVANYEYDPYGKVISATGWLAEVNPLRYRGYYYDTETQLYHLWSRYYDPQTGRFISADEFSSTGQGVLGTNMYAYCGNNPTNRRDIYGNAWETVLDVISLCSSIVEVSCNPTDVGAWIGLVGDVIDVAVPFVAGVGETVRLINTGRKVADIADVADDVNDTRKVASKIHGNSLSSNNINYGYQLLDSDKNILKYGESKNPLKRYSQKWLGDNGYEIQIVVAGTKKGVHEWQHDMILNYAIIAGHRPPHNYSLW